MGTCSAPIGLNFVLCGTGVVATVARVRFGVASVDCFAVFVLNEIAGRVVKILAFAHEAIYFEEHVQPSR